MSGLGSNLGNAIQYTTRGSGDDNGKKIWVFDARHVRSGIMPGEAFIVTPHKLEKL